jgi:polyhydroxyalkanoate synthesis regulator phasin
MRARNLRGQVRQVRGARAAIVRYLGLFLLFSAAIVPAHGRDKNVLAYGEGLIVNIPMPEPEVTQVVEEIVENSIIRGTKEYNKDEYVTGAVAATSTNVFPEWTDGGKVFYKVKKQALDPRGFKDSGDLGTLAVRYVVMVQGFENTVLRIDAVFVEDFRHSVHPSDGSVETNEYKDIREHLDAIELMKKENAEAIRAKQDRLAAENFGLGSDSVLLSTPPPDTTGENTSSHAATPQSALASSQPETHPLDTHQPETLEQHVAELRRQVERLVKKPGAPLKSAPFRSASTIVPLEPGAEVLIQIATPYWYGVETREGQHGWLRRDELDTAP